jgi:hypothetical protein
LEKFTGAILQNDLFWKATKWLDVAIMYLYMNHDIAGSYDLFFYNAFFIPLLFL